MVCRFAVTLGTCHEIAGKGVVPFEKMDSHSLSRVFSDQSKLLCRCSFSSLFRLLSQHLSVSFFGLLVLFSGLGGGAQGQGF